MYPIYDASSAATRSVRGGVKRVGPGDLQRWLSVGSVRADVCAGVEIVGASPAFGSELGEEMHTLLRQTR